MAAINIWSYSLAKSTTDLYVWTYSGAVKSTVPPVPVRSGPNNDLTEFQLQIHNVQQDKVKVVRTWTDYNNHDDVLLLKSGPTWTNNTYLATYTAQGIAGQTHVDNFKVSIEFKTGPGDVPADNATFQSAIFASY